MRRPVVAVHGAQSFEDVPGLEKLRDAGDFRFAAHAGALPGVLRGADIMLGWNFAAADLRDAWHAADRLRWIQWCGAGVDAAMCPALIDSEVVLTNAHGLFDQPIAEYTLALILALAKDLPRTLASQRACLWDYRLNERITGCKALVVGVGGIGRAIGRTLTAVGLQVDGVGRQARAGGEAFDTIHAIADLDELLPLYDYIVLITPLTDATRGLFDTRRLALLPSHARFINLGRGALVNQQALIDALREQRIAGAALDVFEIEPLPADSALWGLENVIVSPHMSGDFKGFDAAMVDLFVENFARYQRGDELMNIVDKALGFVPGKA